MNSRTWRWRGVRSVIGGPYHDHVFGANTRSGFRLTRTSVRANLRTGVRSGALEAGSRITVTPPWFARHRGGPNRSQPQMQVAMQHAGVFDAGVFDAGVITITTRATARQRPTTLPRRAVASGAARVVSRATYRRRRAVVVLLAVVLVLVMARAGAALGGSTPLAPERHPAHTSASTAPATQL